MIKEEKLRLDKDIKLFADELKRCFSKEEIKEIARETGFVKRKGKQDKRYHQSWGPYFKRSWIFQL